VAGSPLRAIRLAVEGQALRPTFSISAAKAEAERLHIEAEDAVLALHISIEWSFGAGDVVRCRTTLTNGSGAPLAVDALASLCLPLPCWAKAMTRFHGRWAGEMREAQAPIPHGLSGANSSEGRPGFGGGQFWLVHEADASKDRGRTIGIHLAWSGDHEAAIARNSEGAMLVIGAGTQAGEIVVDAGASYTTPEALFVLGRNGRNAVRSAFHQFIREDVLPSRPSWPERRVHINSWEALGFDLDHSSVVALAAAGASVGAERLVLDDGWFAGRRDDTSSLGDWQVDRTRFPGGLGPLIDEIAAHGLDFGLWVEPEMISPDSNLYRAHPDWCLHEAGRARPTQRQQLVLDLTREDVSNHVFDQIDALLRDHAIAYLKWDHNRALDPIANPGGSVGRAQVLALYDLIDRLRAAHPAVEIEACASGGARIDLEMLRRTHRVWPSDNNDPIERARIQAAWSLFLPPEVLGSHVGPSPNPITGRRTAMDLRTKLAMFGHMGIEADLAAMDADERASLAAHVALYKTHRDWLHRGIQSELAFGDAGMFGALIRSRDGLRALALAGRTDMAAEYEGEPVRLVGLNRARKYGLQLLQPWPRLAAKALHDPEAWLGGPVMSGALLADHGVFLPLSLPETAWLILAEAVQ
jgi:alpha-galactosidase